MSIDSAHIRLLGILAKSARALRPLLRGLGDSQRSASAARTLLTPEQFQEELVTLDLSSKRFRPEEYSEALGNYLGISIVIHVIPDAWYPEFSRRLASSGRLGELRYSEESGLAAIIVPGSLPPLVLVLTILHELGHLAAGDHLIEPDEGRREDPLEHVEETMFTTSRIGQGKSLARTLPLADENLREHEANLRASYALVAGCLGSESPYAHDMYNVL